MKLRRGFPEILRLAALLLLVDETRARAGSFESVFAISADGAVCFARTYDAAHLRAHPRQKVESIELDMTPANPDGVPATAKRFELGVGVKPRGSSEWYGGNAICATKGQEFSCYLEGDGGDLKLTALASGELEVATSGLVFEGGDFLEIGGKKSDDGVFVLRRAPRAKCDVWDKKG